MFPFCMYINNMYIFVCIRNAISKYVYTYLYLIPKRERGNCEIVYYTTAAYSRHFFVGGSWSL